MTYKDDILLCDLDAFFASVEQHDHPEYRGKPVIIGGKASARGVVATCSYEARKFNVHSAMPMRKALELCPQAIVLPVRMRRYQTVSREVRTFFQCFTPDIEPVSIDEAYLAVKGGTGIETAKKVRAAIKENLGIAVTVGISSNKLLAKIACELVKPDGLKALWQEDVPNVLWPLSVRMIPGIGHKATKKLGALGVETVGQLTKTSPEILKNVFGNSYLTMQQYSQGIDNRKLVKAGPIKSISEETTFTQDIVEQEDIQTVLMKLSETVGYRLRSSGVRARTLTLKLRFADFRTITRTITLAESTNSDSLIYRTVSDLFSRHKGHPPWRLLGVRASGLERSRQLSFWQVLETDEREEKITAVLDELKKKYGKQVIHRARSLGR